MWLVRRILFIVNIVAALLLLGSTLAGVVRPSRFLWFSMLSYGFVPLLAINVAFVLLWLFFGRKEFLLSTLVIVLRFSMVPLFFQVGGTQQSDEPSLGLLTCNVHHFHGRDFVADVTDLNVIDSNAHEFLSIVDSLKPDILCLEEYAPIAHKTDVSGALTIRGYKHSACALLGKSRAGVVLYSKHPIVRINPIDTSSKMSVDLCYHDDTLRLFCLHLGSYQLDEEDFRQIDDFSHGDAPTDSIRGTLRKFKQTILLHDSEWTQLDTLLQQSPYPSLVVGDFNDTPASFIYHQIVSRGFSDCYREQGKGFCTTYHGKFPAFRIDYVLHSSQFDCLAYRRMRSDISDHYPIFVQLQLVEKNL